MDKKRIQNNDSPNKEIIGQKRTGKKNNMAHLLSLIAIVVLVLCLVLVIFLRTAYENGRTSSERMAEALNEGDTPDVLIEIDGVKKQLKRLEGALDDGNNLLNTLQKDGEKDNTSEIEKLLERLEELKSEIEKYEKEVTTLKEIIVDSKEKDNDIILNHFTNIYAKVDELKKQMNDVLNLMTQLEIANKEEVLNAIRNMSDSINMKSEDNKNQIVTGMSDLIKNLQAAMNKRFDNTDKGVSSGFDSTGAAIESGFGKTGKDINSAFEKTADSVKSGLSKTAETVNGELARNTDEVKGELAKAKQEVNTGMSVGFGKAGENMTAGFNKAEENMTAGFNKAEENMTAGFTKTEENIAAGFNKAEESIASGFDRTGENIVSGFDKAGENMAAGFSKTSQDMASGFQNTNQTITQNFNSVNTSIGGLGESIMSYLSSMYGNIENRFTRVDSNMQEVFQYVASGKKSIASALATVGTSMEKDADSQYTVQTFDTLSDKVAHSQDIKGEVDTPEGLILLSGASENNLPLGTAAWVAGHFVIGNGKDIENAYTEGIEDAKKKMHIEYDYHVHDESCRGEGYHVHSEACEPYNTPKRDGYFVYLTDFEDGSGRVKTVCSVCGYEGIDNLGEYHCTEYESGYRNCNNEINTYKYTCGMNEGQIVSAHIVFD